MTEQKPKVLALLGPTASGKTRLALELAQAHPIEIISLDSALVYKDMDIGTAKPSHVELAQVPHHLIDIITPLESYNAADFCRDCLRLIDEISSRNKTPVIVGGTMMYYKALNEGLATLPSADQDIRAQLQHDLKTHGIAKLYQQLQEADPETAMRLKPTDSQRIERALEVFILTGKPLSQHFAEQQQNAPKLNLYSIALIPEDRHALHHVIATRFQTMLQQGFLDEVRALQIKYPELHPDLPSMRCVGYRQAWEHLDGKIDFNQLAEQGIIATRQLAKRQLTWLRSLSNIQSIDPYIQKNTQTIALLLSQLDS